MIGEFLDWLEDAIDSVCETIVDAAKLGGAIFITAITFPLWIIPFLYWYFRKWKKHKEPETDIKDEKSLY